MVRAVFGHERCLFGNLDSEHLLTTNNVEEIRQGVLEQIRFSGHTNPFVMCTGSPIPSDADMSAVDTMVQVTHDICQQAGIT
jgi:uroporphyrinogen-III decarboxylase